MKSSPLYGGGTLKDTLEKEVTVHTASTSCLSREPSHTCKTRVFHVLPVVFDSIWSHASLSVSQIHEIRSGNEILSLDCSVSPRYMLKWLKAFQQILICLWRVPVYSRLAVKEHLFNLFYGFITFRRVVSLFCFLYLLTKL